MNCEWANWGSWYSPNGNENEDRCACDKSKIERFEIIFLWSLQSRRTNISTIVLCRVQITHCFSDSQNRSRFVQIEQIRNRYVKSYAAGGEKCNKKDEIEKRLCKPCESGIIISSL